MPSPDGRRARQTREAGGDQRRVGMPSRSSCTESRTLRDVHDPQSAWETITRSGRGSAIDWITSARQLPLRDRLGQRLPVPDERRPRRHAREQRGNLVEGLIAAGLSVPCQSHRLALQRGRPRGGLQRDWSRSAFGIHEIPRDCHITHVCNAPRPKATLSARWPSTTCARSRLTKASTSSAGTGRCQRREG